MLVVGLLLFTITLALRGASVNRFVRRRLTISCALFAMHAADSALVAFGRLPDSVADQIRTANPLLLAFGLSNALVVLAINPWRGDSIPERFPNIVQDAIVIAIFGLAAMLFLPEKIVATTAVGAVVVGFALQDTLGNLFAGLAIQIEKPFRVGHWVTIGGQDGMVSEITWRATKIRTKAGNFVVVPNNVLSRDTITNYSEPTHDTRVEVEIGASYDTPPNDVKAVVREAVRGEPLIVAEREPEILVADFAASAITYRVRVWTNDFSADERVRDHVRARIYYAFRRHHITIPYPIQVQVEGGGAGVAPSTDAATAAALAGVDILAALTDEQRELLVEAARSVVYGAGEIIVRQSDPGRSMFVLVRGEATVRLSGTDGDVARLRDGAFFGEMSLLTGEPRSATVTAVTDCALVEIGTEAFRRVVMTDQAILERISAAVATRRAELDRHRETKAVASGSPETTQTFLARVRQFLRLSA